MENGAVGFKHELAPAAPPSPKKEQKKTAPPPLTKRPEPPPLPVPLAAPVTPAVPIAMPVAPSESANLAFDDPSAVVSAGKRRTPRRSRSKVRLVLFAVLAVLVLAVIATGITLAAIYMPRVLSGGDQNKPYDGSAFNFKFQLPGAPWKVDEKLKLTMQTQLAMRRSNPSAGLALHFYDYKKRIPPDSELKADALEKLKLQFKNVEWEVKDPDPERTLGGQPCLCVEFVGVDPDEVRVNGFCYMLAYRGFAYWLYTWAPDETEKKETNQKESDRLRKGFTLLGDREGWTEQKPQTSPVQGTKIPFRLLIVKDRWRKLKDTDGYDPKTDLVLLGTYPGEKPHAGKMATIQALVLDKADSLEAAKKAAHDYLLEAEKQKQEENKYLFPNAKLDGVDDKSILNTNDKVGADATEGWLLKLRLEKEPENIRYVVLRILPQPNGVLVLWCECDYQYLIFWDQEFTVLLETLTVK